MISKFKEAGLGIAVIIAIIALVLAISWGGTCLLVWLITLCFGWEFSFAVATGVWLLIILLKNIFSVNVNNKYK